MPDLAILVVLALATYRLTRVVTTDSISDGFRAAVYRFAYDDAAAVIDEQTKQFVAAPRAPWRTWLYALFSCPHCLGVWVGIGVYCAWRWGSDAALAVLAVAALTGAQSALASFVSAAEGDE